MEVQGLCTASAYVCWYALVSMQPPLHACTFPSGPSLKQGFARVGMQVPVKAHDCLPRVLQGCTGFYIGLPTARIPG
eukprot:1160698-Pelagomonas_calceolata.AAC.4